jgi:hypothetical protein
MPQTRRVSFEGTLASMRGGGHAIAVDPEVVAPIGARHGTRVRGEVAGAPMRSNLAKMSGTLWLGVHKATFEAAGLSVGDAVRVDLEVDDAPLPTDTVPDDLARALRDDPAAAAAWDRLAPSHRRAHVGAILDAKRPETRARRVASTVEALGGSSA